MDKKLKKIYEENDKRGVLKVITSRQDVFCVKSLHPRNEVFRAKDLCDIRKEWGDFGVAFTVSPYFVQTVQAYGVECLGIDVRYYIDYKEVTYDDMMDSFYDGDETLDFVLDRWSRMNNNKNNNKKGGSKKS